MKPGIEQLLSSYYTLADGRQQRTSAPVELQTDEQVRAHVRRVLREELPELPESDPGYEIRCASQLLARRFHREWDKLVAEALDHAMLRLRILVAQLTERFGATSGWLFFKEGDGLSAQVTHHSKQRGFELTLDGPGIVPLVARTDIGYLTKEVDRDPHYLRVNEETRSELAVPILDTDGRLLGVLNLESRLPNQFTDEQVGDLSQAVSCLVLHMLVIQHQQSCPYHPERHGWDLSFVLNRLCRTIAEALDEAGGGRFADTTSCTVWYCDHAKQVLFVYATSGFDIEYIADATLPMRSFIGQVARFRPGKVEDISPWDAPNFRRLDRIETTGVKRILATPIYVNGLDQPRRASATLNVYSLNERQQNAKTTEKAFATIASEIGSLIAAYRNQRPRLARAYLRHQLHELPQPAATGCEVIKDVLKTIFDANGCSILAPGVGPEHNRYLHFATTTGIENWSVGAINPTGGHPYYHLDRDPGFTSYVASHPGTAVRKNDVMNCHEKGVPDDFPSMPLDKYREKFALSELDRRRFLGIGVACDSSLRGVVRLNRASTSKPFTHCDQELLERLAELDECKRTLIDFQKQHTVERPTGIVEAVASFLRPVPVPNVGSVKTCVEELLQSLAVIFREHRIGRVGVMVEPSCSEKFRTRWYACHHFRPRESHDAFADRLALEQPWEVELNRQTWAERERIVTFDRRAVRNARGAGDAPTCGIRVPVIAWTGREHLRMMLALDFDQDIHWGKEEFFDVLFHATRRLSAILSPSDFMIRPEALDVEPAAAMAALVALTERHSGIQAEGAELHFKFDTMMEPVFRVGCPFPSSAEAERETAQRIPLLLGPFAVGELRCELGKDRDVHKRRDELLRTIPALWSRLTCELQRPICDRIRVTPEVLHDGVTRWNEHVNLRRLNFPDALVDAETLQLFSRV